ncbi:MAG: hypothetical protein C0466_07810 [Candidatus Accumulibacter sp.]|nr:hypothetical protein [Accumulibacter sp.]
MGRRSKIAALPGDVLDALNARLIGSGFSDYAGLAAWLQEQGFDISRTALHRHGSALEEEFETAMADARRTRALARAAREESDDDDGALLGAASSIMQDSLLRVSLELKNSGGEPGEKAKALSLVSRAFADVGRFDLARQKWQEELRFKAAEVAEKAAKLASKGGLSAESVAEIRRSILGIAA